MGLVTEPIATTDRAELLTFIVAQQASPASATAYLGDEAAGVEARNTRCPTTWFCSPRIRLAETSITAEGVAPPA